MTNRNRAGQSRRPSRPRSHRRTWVQGALLGAAVTGLLILGRAMEVDTYLSVIREWVSGFGRWGFIAYGAAYVVATLLFFPGTPFTVLAALLFGTLWGFITMMGATTASAVIAFLIARHLAKGPVERRLAQTENFGRLRNMVERNRRFAIPAIRFLPMFPYAFNNYALGLTNISFGSYLLWSEVVFIPMNAVLILGAGALYRALILGETSWGLIGGTTAAGLAVLALGYAARRRFGANGSPGQPAQPESLSREKPHQ